jgi:hypothetical protein
MLSVIVPVVYALCANAAGAKPNNETSTTVSVLAEFTVHLLRSASGRRLDHVVRCSHAWSVVRDGGTDQRVSTVEMASLTLVFNCRIREMRVHEAQWVVSCACRRRSWRNITLFDRQISKGR